ncbi:MAG TPA: DUF6754 domain-containing protein [Candidatus Limnocylindria bacterium]|nr:DUF6754 domain-containing protein [Candidatus Limnocylindria bacterium]
MPNLGELAARLVEWIGELVNASSLRLGVAPTLAILVVLLVLLSLVARPRTRWVTRDAGRLAGLGRSMALAAEGGAEASISLGTSGIARATSAVERLQTLAVLPLLDHVARGAARAGVRLRVTTNDPVVAHLAEGGVADAHVITGTLERRARSGVEFLGEGRLPAAGISLGGDGRRVAGFVLGGVADEALLLYEGLALGPTGARVGSAEVAEASSVLLQGTGTLVGADLFAAPAELRPAGHARTAVLATNRLIGLVVVVIGLAVVWAAVGGDSAALLDVR